MSGYDALSLATIGNILTASDLPDINNYIGTNYTTMDEQTQADLSDILSETQLKRACCLANLTSTNTNVRLPIFPEAETILQNEQDNPYSKLALQYGYYDRSTKMPVPSMCPTGYNMIKNSNDPATYNNCNNFFKVYCANIIKEFKQENPDGFDYAVFSNYKPECACFVPMPSWLKNLDANIAPKCIFPGCLAGTNPSGGRQGVWLDSVSKNSDCNLTICQANINISETDAGRDVSIKNRIEQECGRQQNNSGTGGTGGTGTGGIINNPTVQKYGFGIIVGLCVCFIIFILIIAIVFIGILNV